MTAFPLPIIFCLILSPSPVLLSHIFPTTEELVKLWGYECTTYNPTTEDGYRLTLHRIGNQSGPPVFLQHGLGVSASSWVLRGPQADLVFSLMDAGYDVWIGHFRGTFFTKGHIVYNKTDPEFWRYSAHELGIYDVPACIDLIINIRQTPQIFYIGHSLGSTVFLIMASSRPEYNHKIRAAVLMSPVSTVPSVKDLGSGLLRTMLLQNRQIYKALTSSGIYEIFTPSKSLVRFLQTACGRRDHFQDYCLDLLGEILGEHRINLERDKLAFYVYSLSGLQVEILYHLSQFYATGEFKQYDHGPLENKILYNSSHAPLYPLHKISAPIYIFWGINDKFTSEESMMELASMLPSLRMVQPVRDPKCNHVDMILGKNAKKMLYEDVVHILSVSW